MRAEERGGGGGACCSAHLPGGQSLLLARLLHLHALLLAWPLLLLVGQPPWRLWRGRGRRGRPGRRGGSQTFHCICSGLPAFCVCWECTQKLANERAKHKATAEKGGAAGGADRPEAAAAANSLAHAAPQCAALHVFVK